MPDWKHIIDRAIAQRTMVNFVTFRAERELDARDGSLKNPAVPVDTDGLIEDFLLDETFIDIGAQDLERFCERLAAAVDPDRNDGANLNLMGLCFEALVCIRELEAQILRQRSANQILQQSSQSC